MNDPIMAEFVANLPAINALADQAQGFVWRLQTEDGDATAVRPYADSVEEAVARLAHLEAHGPTPYAFSFAQPFDAEGLPAPLEGVTRDDACPAT